MVATFADELQTLFPFGQMVLHTQINHDCENSRSIWVKMVRRWMEEYLNPRSRSDLTTERVAEELSLERQHRRRGIFGFVKDESIEIWGLRVPVIEYD